MHEQQYPSNGGPTLIEWGVLRTGLIALVEAMEPEFFGSGGLLNALLTDDQRHEEIRRRFSTIRDTAAFKWVVGNDAISRSREAFRKTNDPTDRDQFRFLSIIVFYLEGYYLAKAAPAAWTSPTAETRRAAAATARVLASQVSGKHAGFASRVHDRQFVDLLRAYADEQESLASKRKPREDKTSDARRFVHGLAVSMIRQFGTCKPAVVKPLGVLVDYVADDRGWVKLLAKARTSQAE